MYNFCIIKILIKHTTEGTTQYKNVSNGILDAYTKHLNATWQCSPAKTVISYSIFPVGLPHPVVSTTLRSDVALTVAKKLTILTIFKV